MSNFFRDTSLGFKQQRSNIFSKLKPKSTSVSTSTPSKGTLGHGSTVADDGQSQDFDDGGSANTSANSPSSLMLMDYMYYNHDDSSKDLSSNHTSLNDSVTYPKGAMPLNKNKNRNRNLDELLEDDVDFEITGVREIDDTPSNQSLNLPVTASSHKRSQPTQNVKQIREITPEIQSQLASVQRTIAKDISEDKTNVAITSNDVLLEAFTNTQKICAALKRDLHAEQSKNTKLVTDLRTCKFDMRKINDKIQEYKGRLQEFQEKTNDFAKKSKLDATTIQSLRESQQTLQENMKNYMSEFSSVGKQLASFQHVKLELESELKQKVTELDHARRELDDYSGQLSEEKIRNSSLIQEISKISDEMGTLIRTVSDRYSQQNQEQIIELREYTKESIKTELNEQLTAQNDYFKNFSDEVTGHLITTYVKKTNKLAIIMVTFPVSFAFNWYTN